MELPATGPAAAAASSARLPSRWHALPPSLLLLLEPVSLRYRKSMTGMLCGRHQERGHADSTTPASAGNGTATGGSAQPHLCSCRDAAARCSMKAAAARCTVVASRCTREAGCWPFDTGPQSAAALQSILPPLRHLGATNLLDVHKESPAKQERCAAIATSRQQSLKHGPPARDELVKLCRSQWCSNWH